MPISNGLGQTILLRQAAVVLAESAVEKISVYKEVS